MGNQLVEFAGKLTHGQWGENNFVAVRDCGLVCTCNARSAMYQVRINGLSFASEHLPLQVCLI